MECRKRTIDETSEIEKLLEQIKLEIHFPKLSNKQMMSFMEGIGRNMGLADEDDLERMRKAFLFSGSLVEGATFARNLKSNLQKDYFEFEGDMMFPAGSIKSSYEEKVIKDLDYAKGFVWLKYDNEGVHLDTKNGLTEEYFLIEHEDQKYLNSLSFKSEMDINSNIPDLTDFGRIQQEYQGPSNNLDMSVYLKQLLSTFKKTKKEDLDKAGKTLDMILGFLQRAIPGLQRFYELIKSNFLEYEKSLVQEDQRPSQKDIDELLCKSLLSNESEVNKSLNLHWSMIAFVNEIIWAIEILHSTVLQHELEKRIGFWKFAFLPLLTYPKSLQNSLKQFILKLFALPKLIRNNDEVHNNVPELFLKECFHDRPSEIDNALNVFERCFKVIVPRYHVFQAISYDYKDSEPPVNDNLDEANVNIDRVPAIIFEGWPAIADEFKKRNRVWPSPETMDEIFQKGCHLVPKPYNGPESNPKLDWRWSFSQTEMILAEERTDKMDMVYLILKSLFYIYFKSVEHDGESLPSYFAKTLMMWECERHPLKWWEQKSVTECVIILLNQLKSHFYDRFLPHYFISDLNLFGNISDELIDFGLAICESICQDPVKCVLDVTQQIIDKQSSNQQSKIKTTKKRPEASQILGRGSTDEKIKKETESLPLVIAEFREALKTRENNFKDIPQKKGALAILRKILEEQIPEMWPDLYKESLSIQPEFTEGDIGFMLTMNSIEDELTLTSILRVDFKGSCSTTLEMTHNG